MTDEELKKLALAMYSARYGQHMSPTNPEDNIAFAAVYAACLDFDRANLILDTLMEEYVEKNLTWDVLPHDRTERVLVEGEWLIRPRPNFFRGGFKRLQSTGEWYRYDASSGPDFPWIKSNPFEQNRLYFRQEVARNVDKVLGLNSGSRS